MFTCVCEWRQTEEKPRNHSYILGAGGGFGGGEGQLLQSSLAGFSARLVDAALKLSCQAGLPPLKAPVSSTAWSWGYQPRRRERERGKCHPSNPIHSVPELLGSPLPAFI